MQTPADSLLSPPSSTPELEPFTRQLLLAMTAFRDGDFTVRMPGDMVGIPGKIADAFNDIVTVSERRAGEVARISRVVGKEGRLRERMIVPAAHGTRADEVIAI